MHTYRGFRYQIIIWDCDTLRYKIFERGIRNRFFRWNKEYVLGERDKIEPDECEESFVVRIHQTAHGHIDAMADKNERMDSLVKVTRDKGVEFLSRIAK